MTETKINDRKLNWQVAPDSGQTQDLFRNVPGVDFKPQENEQKLSEFKIEVKPTNEAELSKVLNGVAVRAQTELDRPRQTPLSEATVAKFTNIVDVAKRDWGYNSYVANENARKAQEQIASEYVAEVKSILSGTYSDEDLDELMVKLSAIASKMHVSIDQLLSKAGIPSGAVSRLKSNGQK